jgi:hypothetical protein
MTVKDYEVIADVIRNVEELDFFGQDPYEAEPVLAGLVELLCVAFQRDNPRFHKATFHLRALGCLPSEASVPAIHAPGCDGSCDGFACLKPLANDRFIHLPSERKR